ncbi:Uncharacterised protein [Helicobacter fennelliae]|uniref:Uncharacterized protein n=1 Tax=Helicobacter fennelliae TaxID=215 RepID=A0A2X3DYT6_9HELI|nr:hypothetical protein [Helicobacter fennelliae]SQC36442.1 Uncharacterised protein [Helicobacter fennelliae]
MLIEKAIVLLNEFAETKKDEDFKEFAQNLTFFVLKYKNEHNINDIKTFIDLMKQNTDDKNKEQLKRAISSISLAEECIQNGFVDYEKFYKNFKEYKLEDSFVQEESNLQSNKEFLETNTNKEDIVSKELLTSLQDLTLLSEDSQNKKQEVQRLQNLKEEEDFYKPEIAEKKQTYSPSVNAMLGFIKDKDQIHFPFAKEETLNSKFFMLCFNKELKRMGVQEIQKLIDSIKAKNEALRKEIEELDEQKINLMKELKEELIDNQKLSTLNEINQKDAEQRLEENKSSIEESPKHNIQNEKFSKVFKATKNRNRQ